MRQLLPLRQFRDLGPACYLDAARYADRRAKDGPTPSRLLYEVFYAFFLPQFEGMDENRAAQLYKVVAAAARPARAGRGPPHHRRRARRRDELLNLARPWPVADSRIARTVTRTGSSSTLKARAAAYRQLLPSVCADLHRRSPSVAGAQAPQGRSDARSRET